jgi:hypothetical protein
MPIPMDPTLDGYVFDGWTSDIPLTMPDGNVVIYGTMSKVAGLIEDKPAEPEQIPEEATPLAGGPGWALPNLILAAASALASLWMIFGLIGRKKDVEDGVITPETQRRQGVARILSLLPGAAGILAFVLTENINSRMIAFDHWTIYLAGIAFVQLLLVIIGTTEAKRKDRGKQPEKPWTYDILKGV